MNNIMFERPQAPKWDAILFCLILVLLMYEQINFGHPLLSLYKVVIFPLSLFASYRLACLRPGNGLFVGVFAFVGLVFIVNLTYQQNLRDLALPISMFLTAYYFSAYSIKYRLPRYLNWVILFSSLPQILLFAVVQKYFIVWAYDEVVNSTRFKGFASDPNFMCFILTASVVAGGLICLNRKQNRLFKNSVPNLALVVFAGTVILANVFIILQSGSRSGVLFLVLAAIFVFGARYGYAKVGVLVGVVGAFLYGTLRQLISFVRYSDSDSTFGQLLWRFKILIEGNPNKSANYGNYLFNDNRAYLWEHALPYLKEDLLFGHGRHWFMNEAGNYSHNSYIDLMLDCGTIAGGVLVVALFVLSIRMGITMLTASRRIRPDLAFFAAFVPIYLSGMFFFSLSSPKFTWVVVTFLLLVNVGISESKRQAPRLVRMY